MQNTSENKIDLYIVRHGKTLMNEQKKYVGWTDESLSDNGKKEITDLVKNKRFPEIDILFSSPMKRCIETGKLLYPNLKSYIIEELKEINFGEFEGKNFIELSNNENYQRWIDSGGTMTFPDGESRQEFIKRNMCGMDKIMAYIRSHYGSVLNKEKINVGVIAHGGTIMSVLSEKYGGDYYDYQIGNGYGYKCALSISDNEWKIIQIEKL